MLPYRDDLWQYREWRASMVIWNKGDKAYPFVVLCRATVKQPSRDAKGLGHEPMCMQRHVVGRMCVSLNGKVSEAVGIAYGRCENAAASKGASRTEFHPYQRLLQARLFLGALDCGTEDNRTYVLYQLRSKIHTNTPS